MNANQQHFWMLADPSQWALPAHAELAYREERRSLRLASKRILPPPADSLADLGQAQSRLELIPQTRDEYGARAFWDATAQTVMATGVLPGNVPILATPAGARVSDLALGYDGVLYLAIDGRVIMHDRRGRWSDVILEAPGFQAWRLAADPAGGVWALDRTHRLLARVEGMPLPERPFGEYATHTFRPCEENPTPPRLAVLPGAVWPVVETPVAIACGPNGRLATLSWLPDGDASLRWLKENGALSGPITLQGARHPYSLAWISEDRVAVLLANVAEAPVYTIEEPGSSSPVVGDLYPLPSHDGGPFLHVLSLPPHFPTAKGSAPLHPLSMPSFVTEGEAIAPRPFDSGNARTEWDRLYLEAAIPPHCAIIVWLAATEDQTLPASNERESWHEHRFGQPAEAGEDREVPRGAWLPDASEIPHHPGLLHCPPERDRAGLFTALIQRAGRRGRTLRGRYLWVRVELSGDGRTTPELAALRAYAPRFSYLDNYLPELYRESEFGPEADAAGPSTRADFLGRFLANFEGILTPLEDRIAHAHLLTDTRSTPDEALEWLGTWIGVAFDPASSSASRRTLLRAAPWLFRKRGTLTGLKLALEIATGGHFEQVIQNGRAREALTGGGITGGEIVVLEDFRLRRTFATILGADLADENDPLLGGLAVSGNSFVGDTLFLGEEQRKEFLALFSADLEVSDEEADAIGSLFERLAHRVTILAHEEIDPQDLGLIRRVAELETPAHVQTRVLAASSPFMVGLASLVEVDTYLADKPRPLPVEVGRTRVGVRDYLQGSACLDPRLGGGRTALPPVEPPVADAGPDRAEPFGQSFTLDGSGSRAGRGRRIARYIWEKTG